jgi:hypothetical protein
LSETDPVHVSAAAVREVLGALLEASTIRLRCAAITRAADEDRTSHFRIDRSRLSEAAQRVAAITRERYPDLNIPYHSRWRHFEAGGVDRKAQLDALLAGRSREDVARARIDLTVVSVLLDAGAGAQWKYTERPGVIEPLALPVQRQQRDDLLAMLDQAGGHSPLSAAALPAGSGEVYTRSEGLGVASLRAFEQGVFSGDSADPLRVDAQVLERLDVAALRAVFQTSATNPIVGLEGRTELLRQLGTVLSAQAQRSGGPARPARLFDKLTNEGTKREISAAALLREIVSSYAGIWRSGSRVQSLPAGDVWQHPFAGSEVAGGHDGTTSGWVPFHKLSQWLTYSLLEPFEWAGVEVTGVDELTGLPEYRNGGLLLDCGVIVPRDVRDLGKTWQPRSELVVEWRALTVTLLDELAVQVRGILGLDAAGMPLARILEGGTWAAGRRIAQELRGGAPPLKIESDGTLF